MGELEASAAVILRRTAYGEADLIVTLLTERFGKVSALARAARRSKKRFSGALETFTVSRIELRERRGSHLLALTGASVTRSYFSLASDMARFAPASYATELVRELTAGGEPAGAVFRLLVDLYETLTTNPNRFAMRVFEMRLLDYLGLAPAVDRCVACQRAADDASDGRFLWDPVRGGTVCLTCSGQSHGRGIRPISKDGIAVLQRAKLTQDVTSADGEGLTDDQIREARDAMVAMVTAHIGKPLRSLEFIRKIQGTSNSARS